MTEPMNEPTTGPHARRGRSLPYKISALLIVFGVIMALALGLQGTLSQRLIVHPIWHELLASSTAQYLADAAPASRKELPANGRVRGWRFGAGEVPPGMPPYFATLAPGFYDEAKIDDYEQDNSYAVLVTPVGAERVVMAVDITDLEDLQNHSSLASLLIAALSAVMIGGSILWLYRTMRGPMQSLAQRMDELDPAQPGQRLSTAFALNELHDIAVIVNRHLDRVERFIERERSLLDQASHEFRTPIAVIAGAVDVLRLHDLPPAANAPLERIQSTTEDLTQIMAALLFLSREPNGVALTETTRLDRLVAVLVDDHAHLVKRKSACFVVEELQPLSLNCPEAIVRIVVGNLLRNAAENTYDGAISVRLVDGRLRIQDSGAGFDTVAAARRYTQGLRDSSKQGGGQGLGLFLIRRVCERFGWRLHITSDPARGTLAEMDFAADPATPPAAPPSGPGR